MQPELSELAAMEEDIIAARHARAELLQRLNMARALRCRLPVLPSVATRKERRKYESDLAFHLRREAEYVEAANAYYSMWDENAD